MNKKFCVPLAWLMLFFVFAGSQFASAQSKRDLDRAKKLQKEAAQLFQKKNYRDAIERYTQVITILPQAPEAHFWKAYAHYYLNEFDDAIADFDLALAQGYKPLEIYRARSYIHFKKNNYPSAIADAKEGAKLEPDKPYFYQLLGDAYRESGSFDEAADAYKQAAQRAQNRADLYYLAALSYAGAGKTDQQQADAMEAIKRGTQYLGEAWFLVGNSLAAGYRYEEAAGAFEKSISAKPSLRESYEQLSDVYRNLNQFAKAILTQQQLIKLYPDDANLFANLSWYLSLADKPLDAISAAQQSIRLKPNAPAFTNLCRAYNDSKQYANAVQACNSALRIKPDDGETYFYLARANDLLGRPDSATPLYKKAVEGLIKFTNENPNYSDGFYLLGNAYYAVENRVAAIAAYKKCLEVSPRFAKARYNLGYIFTLLGDKTNARLQYDALASLDSALAGKLLQAINEMN